MKSSVRRRHLVSAAAILILAIGGAAVPGVARAAGGGITFDSSPGTGAPPATLGSYHMTPFELDPQPTGMVLAVSAPGSAGSVGFTPALDHLRVGAGWATWSNGYTGDVYWTGSGLSVTVTLPPGTSAFYFYAEPDPFATLDITATTQDGTSSGPIPVNGFAGASYFGFYTDGTTDLQTITVNSVTDFAIGEFGISAGPAPVTNAYVALGDSYQSGEGAYHYIDATIANGCHRSTVSYPFLIKGATGVPGTLRDVACSGATIADLTNGRNGEPPQYNALGDDATLVTIGVSGNDVDFGGTIKACALGPQFSGDLWRLNQTCHGRFDEQTNDLIDKLNTADPNTHLTPLQQVYKTVKDRAKHARIVVVGYPHLFKPSGNFPGCNLIYRSDERWIDAKIDQLDDVIEHNTLSMGAEYTVDGSAFDGHELCGDGDANLNGIVGLGDVESFHPNPRGHRRFADLILGQVRSYLPTATLAIQPGQTKTQIVTVASGQAFASFSTSWPGSDVVTQLTAPNGRTITRTTNAPDVLHLNGPTSELYRIRQPAPGTWTVRLYGADLPPSGEAVALNFAQQPAINQIPVAVATASANPAGTTVTYNATGSHDPDGRIVHYEWDFGDGTAATGATVTHTYNNIGKVDLPSLIVTDTQGALGFAAAPPVKVTYGFNGWAPPISNNGPTHTNAGRALPFKWRLTDPHGNSVTDPGVITSYAFDQPGASFTLTTTDGQYVLVANTPKAWAGTTRTFTLKLNDDTTHTAVIQF